VVVSDAIQDVGWRWRRLPHAAGTGPSCGRLLHARQRPQWSPIAIQRSGRSITKTTWAAEPLSRDRLGRSSASWRSSKGNTQESGTPGVWHVALGHHRKPRAVGTNTTSETDYLRLACALIHSPVSAKNSSEQHDRVSWSSRTGRPDVESVKARPETGSHRALRSISQLDGLPLDAALREAYTN